MWVCVIRYLCPVRATILVVISFKLGICLIRYIDKFLQVLKVKYSNWPMIITTLSKHFIYGMLHIVKIRQTVEKLSVII